MGAAFVLGAFIFGNASYAVAGEEPVTLGGATHVTAMVNGPEGKLWFSGVRYGNPGDGVIGSVALDGQVHEFVLPSEGLLEGIAVGPNGNLWFTQPETNQIGRISPNGDIERYALPVPGAQPTAIVQGLDESMWYSQRGSSSVGRFKNEQTQDFALPSGSQPDGIVVGPDGAIWVTETAASRIVRIVDGTPPQEFPLPDPTAHPEQITVGPDNALWFTENGAPAIGRITADGQVTEFPVRGKAGTSQISRGPGNVLWYSNLRGKIGSITTKGRTARPECPLVICTYPITALAEGSDGELWYGTGVMETEGGGGTAELALNEGSKVGRFSPAAVEARFGSHPSSIRGRVTTLSVRCEGGLAGTSCEGNLRLYRHHSLLAARNYRLLTGTGRRIALHLSPRTVRKLSLGGSIRMRATVSVRGGKGDSQKFVLKSP
jgi:virginiamycin B lyase